MKKIMKNFCIILTCLFMVFLNYSIQVSATEPIDTEAKCSLNVTFTPDNLKAQNVTFRIYKVADVSYACKFTATDDFKNQDVIKSLDDPTTETYRTLASTLPGIISSNNIKETKSVATNSKGVATFDGLDTGLYLVICDVYHATETYYTPETFMVSLPEYHTEKDTWNYNVSSIVKWEKHVDSEPVDIQMLKVWSDSSNNLHKNDTVSVSLYKNGVLYDTQTLNTSNSWTYKWSGLYGGAQWTVSEKAVTGYTTTIERQSNTFVVTNTIQSKSKSASNGKSSSSKLPQTGLLWWPVSVLIVSGMAFVLLGYFLMKKDKKYEKK